MNSTQITVITGEFNGRRVARIEALGWGRCFIDRLAPHKRARPYPGEPWIFDNGAFRWFKQGVPFQSDTYRQRLGHALATEETPLFAVVPDVVAGGLDSLAFSLKWLDSGELPQHWPWYFAVQDGMTTDDVAPILARHDVAGLFIGGSDDFKATAAQWTELAHSYGKLCHYGRASTPRKLELAIKAGCDSCDSAFVLWTEERFQSFVEAWADLTELPQQVLSYIEAGCPITSATEAL